MRQLVVETLFWIYNSCISWMHWRNIAFYRNHQTCSRIFYEIRNIKWFYVLNVHFRICGWWVGLRCWGEQRTPRTRWPGCWNCRVSRRSCADIYVGNMCPSFQQENYICITDIQWFKTLLAGDLVRDPMKAVLVQMRPQTRQWVYKDDPGPLQSPWSNNKTPGLHHPVSSYLPPGPRPSGLQVRQRFLGKAHPNTDPPPHQICTLLATIKTRPFVGSSHSRTAESFLDWWVVAFRSPMKQYCLQYRKTLLSSRVLPRES